MSGPDLVAVGMDVGGTATRVLVVDTGGRRRGAGRGAGGNPTAHRREVWADAMSQALHQALAAAGPVEVGSVVAGIAGGPGPADGDAAETFKRIIGAEAGRSCQIQVTSDVVIAFAAGTPEPDGTVLVAGTGAAAAAIRGRSLVSETDGYGWLLGDAGSGFWIGSNAVRAVLADLDSRGPATGLRPLIIEALLGQDAAGTDDHRTCREIVNAVYARPPLDLSKLAPLVTRCAGEGDRVALGIAQAAVDHLVCDVEAVRGPGETTPIVVTGGIAAGEHAIAALLRQRLGARWPMCVRAVNDGVAGAAWLALTMLPGIGEQNVNDLHHVLARAR